MVDLIPAEYHRGLRLQRLLRGFGWTCLAIVLAFGVSVAALARAVHAERAALARFKQLQAQNAAWQARLAELNAQKSDAARRLRALDALRGGAPIGHLFGDVDAALNGQVWFRELEFVRGDEAGANLSQARPQGRIEAVDAHAPAAPHASPRAGRAEIRGIAADHAALADFIRQLGTRPGVSEIRLRDTSARSYPNVQVVDFDLAAVVDAVTGVAQ